MRSFAINILGGSTLSPSSGGTGTSTVFTQGSVVFAGASGVYSQDNANFFWDNTNNYLGVGVSPPLYALDISSLSDKQMRLNAPAGERYISQYFYLDNVAKAQIFYDHAALAFCVGGGAGNVELRLLYGSGITGATLDTSGRFGIGVTPSAYLHVVAGTATAGTAPLKLTAGTNLSVVENGAFEYDGTNLYFTTGGVRRTVTLI